MAVTCYYSGRMGNCIFSAAMAMAYAKKHRMTFYLPTEAVAYKHFRNGDVTVPFYIPPTGEKPINPKKYFEPDHVDGNPTYHIIPRIENVSFWGYYQSFKYFDWCRDYILEKFNFPYKMNDGWTAISVRRGDCVGVSAFPIAPKEYYYNAIKFMQQHGFSKFLVHSDDLAWCRLNFNEDNFPKADFEFSTGRNEMENYLSISNCENQITARSTFSLTAAWMNRNPNKIVCVPTDKYKWWRSQNLDLIPNYFTKIGFQNPTDEWSV